MTLFDEKAASPEVAPAPRRSSPPEPERVPRFGSATPMVVTVAILVVSVLTWWLIGDPRWSIFGARANGADDAATKSAITSSVLFWTIFGHIFTGFTVANWPFTKLRQPLSGIVQVVIDLIIGVLGTIIFTRLVGGWDPIFSPSAAAGAGYTAAAFIVLIGFYAYAFCSAALGGLSLRGS